MAIIFRPGTFADAYPAFEVLVKTLVHLGKRINMATITSGDSAELSMSVLWESRQPLFEHLASTADLWWVAEQDGQVIGYARSSMRDGVRQLTDFMVLPDQQEVGIGRELMRRAFPEDGARQRVVVATFDTRATVRYLKTGVFPRFPIYEFSRVAEFIDVNTDLEIERVGLSPEALAAIREIDCAILGYSRDADHEWLLQSRHNAFLYKRDGRVVGYGYEHGAGSGPFAVLDERDFPAVLAYAERTAARSGDDFGVAVGAANRTVIDYLLSRRYHMDDFFTLFMTDTSMGQYENYVFTNPAFFS